MSGPNTVQAPFLDTPETREAVRRFRETQATVPEGPGAAAVKGGDLEARLADVKEAHTVGQITIKPQRHSQLVPIGQYGTKVPFDYDANDISKLEADVQAFTEMYGQQLDEQAAELQKDASIRKAEIAGGVVGGVGTAVGLGLTGPGSTIGAQAIGPAFGAQAGSNIAGAAARAVYGRPQEFKADPRQLAIDILFGAVGAAAPAAARLARGAAIGIDNPGSLSLFRLAQAQHFNTVSASTISARPAVEGWIASMSGRPFFGAPIRRGARAQLHESAGLVEEMIQSVGEGLGAVAPTATLGTMGREMWANWNWLTRGSQGITKAGFEDLFVALEAATGPAVGGARVPTNAGILDVAEDGLAGFRSRRPEMFDRVRAPEPQVALNDMPRPDSAAGPSVALRPNERAQLPPMKVQNPTRLQRQIAHYESVTLPAHEAEVRRITQANREATAAHAESVRDYEELLSMAMDQQAKGLKIPLPRKPGRAPRLETIPEPPPRPIGRSEVTVVETPGQPRQETGQAAASRRVAPLEGVGPLRGQNPAPVGTQISTGDRFRPFGKDVEANFYYWADRWTRLGDSVTLREYRELRRAIQTANNDLASTAGIRPEILDDAHRLQLATEGALDHIIAPPTRQNVVSRFRGLYERETRILSLLDSKVGKEISKIAPGVSVPVDETFEELGKRLLKADSPAEIDGWITAAGRPVVQRATQARLGKIFADNRTGVRLGPQELAQDSARVGREVPKYNVDQIRKELGLVYEQSGAQVVDTTGRAGMWQHALEASGSPVSMDQIDGLLTVMKEIENVPVTSLSTMLARQAVWGGIGVSAAGLAGFGLAKLTDNNPLAIAGAATFLLAGPYLSRVLSSPRYLRASIEALTPPGLPLGAGVTQISGGGVLGPVRAAGRMATSKVGGTVAGSRGPLRKVTSTQALNSLRILADGYREWAGVDETMQRPMPTIDARRLQNRVQAPQVPRTPFGPGAAGR